MTDMMNVNPLLDFARKTECSVKLPSQGLWYDEDAIEFNAIGEVDIMPMLPNDEMKIVNPETLISGDAIISVIKSCCPGIKKPEELYYPDVNVLLLGIKKATYGDELIQNSVCPKCWEKKVGVETDELLRLIKEDGRKDISEEEMSEFVLKSKSNVASKITEMEKKGELLITPQEAKYSCEDILNRVTLLPKDCVYETKEGLKIYITPYKCSDKIKFTNKNIQTNRITKFYDNEMKNTKLDKTSPEYINLVEKLVKMYELSAIQTSEIVASCIKKVQLPNGTVVDNQDYIKEFILNLASNYIQDIMEKIDKLNDYGLPRTLECQCQCCGNKWEERFYGFNQADFFGTGSSV